MKKRIAIVGSGPSGIYAAMELLKKQPSWSVNIFERLPTPFGLLRGGVAPDHQKIKQLASHYETVFEQNTHCHFWGGVTIGTDITHQELFDHHNAIIYCHGSNTENSLNINNESLIHCDHVRHFVAWYNGHPDWNHYMFNQNAHSACIIGIGNVAIDAARLLAHSYDELAATDCPSFCIDELTKQSIQTIHILARRGPAQAACTHLELKELVNHPKAQVIVNADDFQLSETCLEELNDSKNTQKKKNVELLKSLINQPIDPSKKHIYLHFFKRPIEFLGDTHVTGIRCESTQLSGKANYQKIIGTGQTVDIACEQVFKSIGYRGKELPPVPFNHEKGRIQHINGRIVDKTDRPIPGLYCAGWIKRGPVGVIGTNKACSRETIHHLLEDIHHLPNCPTPSNKALSDKLTSRGIPVVSFNQWKTIDQSEITQGELIGKPREKYRTLSDLYSAIDQK